MRGPPRVVVILAVQWGYRGDAPARWFSPNPYNHSGGRLIRLIGHRAFLMTNACPNLVFDAARQGMPDERYLRNNLHMLRPTVVLVCGKVAQATFKPDMVGAGTKVFKLLHPAARTWTKQQIDTTARRIQRYTLGT